MFDSRRRFGADRNGERGADREPRFRRFGLTGDVLTRVEQAVADAGGSDLARHSDR